MENQGKQDPAIEMALGLEERVKKCVLEVDAILVKYGCVLNAEFTLNSLAGIRHKIRIIPNPNLLPKPSELFLPPSAN